MNGLKGNLIAYYLDIHIGYVFVTEANKFHTSVEYRRKVAEGKNKMLVHNAVRSKLIHRIYAVVRWGEYYDESYTPSLV